MYCCVALAVVVCSGAISCLDTAMQNVLMVWRSAWLVKLRCGVVAKLCGCEVAWWRECMVAWWRGCVVAWCVR